MQSMLSSILRQGNPLSDFNRGLVLYLDGTYDSVNGWFVDQSGNGNHGTPYNGATTGTGVVGGGMSFDGNNDYVDVGNIPCAGVSELSFCWWMKTTQTGDHHTIIMAGKDLSGKYGFGANIHNSLLRIIMSNPSDNTAYYNEYADTTVNDDDWHYVVMSYSDSQIRYYIDGLEDANSPLSTAATTHTSIDLTLIGKAPYLSNLYDGNLDEIRIYDRALTANEVKALYRLKRV